MKIVHLIDYFQPKVGYQETFLAREHQKLGQTVSVVTSDRYYPFPNYNETYFKLLGKRIIGTGNRIESDIRTIRLSSIEIPGTPLIYLKNLSSTLDQIKPNVIFCHGVYSLTSYFATKYKNRYGYRLIYDTHASYFNTNFYESMPKRIYHILWKFLFLPELKYSADKIFAIGEEERKFLCDDFNLHSNIIPIIRLGVDTNLFTFSSYERKNTRHSLGLNEDIILIVFAGKTIPGKKLELLFTAVKTLQDEKIKILIIGGGDQKYINTFKNSLAKNQAIWVDFVENNNLPKFFSASDLGVWPGDPSQAMLEAMSCKLPLILPDEKETEYLDKSHGVIRFKSGNEQKLKEKIKLLVNNRHFRLKMAENAQKYVKNNLSWDIIAKQSLNLLKY